MQWATFMLKSKQDLENYCIWITVHFIYNIDLNNGFFLYFFCPVCVPFCLPKSGNLITCSEFIKMDYHCFVHTEWIFQIIFFTLILRQLIPCPGQVLGCSGMSISLSYEGSNTRETRWWSLEVGEAAPGAAGVGAPTRNGASCSSPPEFGHVRGLGATCHNLLFTDSQQFINVKIATAIHW